MKTFLLIMLLFLTLPIGGIASVEIQHYICPGGHMCHDPFRPRDRLVLMPEAKLIRMEKEGEFRIYVENTFSSVLRDLRLVITSPAFDIETEPEAIDRLVPGERGFYLVKLKLREGFEPGDYPLRVSVAARSAELKPSIEMVEVVAEEVIIPEVIPEPPVQPDPETIIPEVEPEVKPPQPVVPPEEVLRQEHIVEPSVEERVEPQAEEAGEIVVRVEEFVLAERWYLYLIPILLLIGFLIWRKFRQR